MPETNPAVRPPFADGRAPELSAGQQGNSFAESSQLFPVCVVDNGTGHIKAGLITDSAPTVVMPNVLAKPKTKQQMVLGAAAGSSTGGGSSGSTAYFIGCLMPCRSEGSPSSSTRFPTAS
ncbi:unnamed protein product [Amoebophrya sp. A120]|nr:unnamed protein product [Amoebophrya sp. A120]|eukprot:GSA120T00009922001.1